MILWLFVGSTIAYSKAPSIVHVGKTYVVINAGERHGLAKGDTVCFYERNVSLVACGEVGALRRRLSGVWIEDRNISRLTVGMTVRGESLDETSDAPLATKKEIRAFVRAIKKASKKREATKSEGESEDGSEKSADGADLADGPHRLSVSYVFSMRSPWTYRIPAYSLENELARDGSLWTSDRQVTSSPIGTEVLWVLPLGPSWGWSLGAHARWFAEDRLIVNYDALNIDVGALGVTSARSYGAHVGLEKWRDLVAGLIGIFGARLGYELASVDYKMSQTGGDNSDVIATAASNLSLVTWRGDVALRLPIRSFYLDSMVGVVVPLWMKNTVQVNRSGLRDSLAEAQSAAAEADLKGALAHTRVPVGVQVSVGMGAEF